MAGKGLSPLYVFCGDEEVLLNRAVSAHREALKGREPSLLEGSKTKEAQIVSLRETQPMFGVGRHIVIDEADEVKLEGLLKTSLEEDSSSLSVVTAVIHKAKLPAAWTAVAKLGTVSSHMKLPPWDAKGYRKRIVDEAQRLLLNLDEDAIDALINFLGDNLFGIYNELGKLRYLVEDGFVTKKHVVQIVAPDRPLEPFQVADHVIGRNSKAAMRDLSLLYEKMGDDAHIPLVAALLKRTEQVLVTRQMLERGDSTSIIAIRFDMKERRCQEYLIPLARKYSLAKLRKHFSQLCRLDSQIRSSARSKRTLVETTVLSIVKDQ